MTDRFVGIGGNDGNSGLSWALRKLTLNGAEDTPVVAGDTVYVGPGVYREELTVDVDASSGNEITYIGDVTGENTDGVGGVVRITGSDDDIAQDRPRCIDSGGKDYRIFGGFRFDLFSGEGIYCAAGGVGATNWIIEDCIFGPSGGIAAYFAGAEQDDNTIRRCIFSSISGANIKITLGSTLDDRAYLMENCLFINPSPAGYIIEIERVGGGTVRNCNFISGGHAFRIDVALTEGQNWVVNNCIISRCSVAFRGQVLGDIVEDYNSLYANITARNTCNEGANSETYPPFMSYPILFDGIQFPWWFSELSEWSQLKAIAGTGESTDDLRGQTRPTTSAKKSWGAVQFDDISRSGTQKDAGSYSAKLADAGRMQIKVPVTNVSTDISVEVYREDDYAGDNPQMIIKQPGQSDDVTTDVGGTESFNELTTTLTPAALPPYVIIELVSRNTAAAGDYNVYFDTLAVS